MIEIRLLRTVGWAGFWLVTTACAAATPPPPLTAPHDPQAWVLLGKTLAHQGQLARAEQYLVAAWTEGVPTHEVLPSLLEIALGEGRLRTAMAHIERGRKLDPTDARLLQLAVTVRLALGQDQKARQELEELASLEPRHPEAIYFLGEHFLYFQERNKARHFLEQYVRTWPQAHNISWARHLIARELDAPPEATVSRLEHAPARLEVAP